MKLNICPHCKHQFGDQENAADLRWFVNHLKGCKAQPRPSDEQILAQIQKDHEIDDRAGGQDTAYEKRKFQEDVRRFGEGVAVRNHGLRTAYRSRKGAA